jgi:toxin ParE1/3/4
VSHAWFLQQALADVRAGRSSYEEQKPGLGNEFADAVDAAMQSILAFPAAYPIIRRDARRFLLQRFPYCLYYRVQEEAVIVVACLHVARDPEEHQSRVSG